MNNISAQQSLDSDLQATGAEIRVLRAAINDTDRLSQECLSEIASIANLASFRIKALNPGGHLDDIDNVLTAISYRAEYLMNSINCAAEEVGCNHKEEGREGQS